MALYSTRKYESKESFEADFYNWLIKDEARYCLFWANLGTFQPENKNNDIGGLFDSKGTPCGAWIRSGNYPLVVTLFPSAALEVLAQALAPLSSTQLIGPRAETKELAAQISKIKNCSIETKMEQGIFSCSQVVTPPNPPGTYVRPSPEHLECVATWLINFHIECRLEIPTLEQARDNAHRRIERSTLRMWLDQGGTPVAIASIGGHTPFGNRVGFVYTPTEARGRGYASTLVATATQEELSSGKKHVFLFTDLSNPTSNKIYQNIGYVKVSESVMIHFS